MEGNSSPAVESSSPEPDSDGVIQVDFDEKGSHPQDWPGARKWCAFMAVILPLLLMPLSSTITSPAINDITEEISPGASEIEQELAVSLFILAYCIGPLLLGPLSEAHGRRPVLQFGNVFYLAFNLGCGFAQSLLQLLVFRLLSGFGAGASLAVGASTVSDLFRPDDRGRALALASLGPVLGSCLGPIAGGFLTEYASWRWTFHLTSILGGICIVVSQTLGSETYAPVLLARKGKALAKRMDEGLDSKEKPTQFRTPYDVEKSETIWQVYRCTLSRPFYLLATQPIVQALACYYGFLYGLIYLLLSSFSNLWTDYYGMPVSTGSLNYIGPCIGYTLGAVFCAAITNWAFRLLRARANGQEKPELRLPMMIPAAMLVPVGLFFYGWTAEYKLHWVLPDIGVALSLLGSTVVFQCISAYLLDAFTIYAASANGAVYLTRGLTGFGFPLISPVLYQTLSYGWGNSVLGLVSLCIGLPIPVLLWYYGEKLRSVSSFTKHSMKVAQ